MMLFWADTERYNIACFSKVTTKSLALGKGSLKSKELSESKLAGER